MDRIIVEELEVSYRVGVPDEERAHPQRLQVSLVMEPDFGPAVAGDDISKTINYYEVTQRLLRLGDGRSWRLIETLAEDIARLVVEDFGAARVTVRINKFILPQARCVAVEISRPRAGY